MQPFVVKGVKGFQKNHSVPIEIRAKISETMKKRGGNAGTFRKGHKNYWQGKKRGEGWAKGKKFSEEHKEKIRRGNLGKHSGEQNHFWKGGLSPVRARIYASSEYKKWRQRVFERDYYTCQKCGRRGGKLQAHHLKPFSLFPKLRFDVDNGETNCLDCHRETETYGNFLLTNKKYVSTEIPTSLRRC